MSTMRQKAMCMSVTRYIIFILIVISELTESPVSQLCGLTAAAIWLFMPKIVKLELKMVDKIKKEK